jgi:hypothetical protein
VHHPPGSRTNYERALQGSNFFPSYLKLNVLQGNSKSDQHQQQTCSYSNQMDHHLKDSEAPKHTTVNNIGTQINYHATTINVYTHGSPMGTPMPAYPNPQTQNQLTSAPNTSQACSQALAAPPALPPAQVEPSSIRAQRQAFPDNAAPLQAQQTPPLYPM